MSAAGWICLLPVVLLAVGGVVLFWWMGRTIP
jgi:hypothetical protein